MSELTPATLTFEHIKAWTPEEMKKRMSIPTWREAIYAVVAGQNQAAVEEAQAQIEANGAAAPVEEPIVAPTPTPVPTPEPPPVPKKIVVDYQVRDEDGNPLGRPTHLEAATEEEMRDKIIKAHTEAVKYAHRLRKQNTTLQKEAVRASQAAPAPAPAQMSDADIMSALKDLRSEDPNVQLAAHRKLNAADEAKRQAEKDAKDAEAKELQRQKDVSRKFLELHKDDFYNCQANANLLDEYFTKEQLPWTLENLEMAVDELADRLAPVPKPVVDPTPTNPAPAQPAGTTTTPTVVQPTAVVTEPAAQPTNSAPAQPRPGVNGGLVPGANSAVRPQGAAKGLTMADINAWDGPTMRAKMRNPQTRAEIERVIAAERAKRQ